MWPPKEGGSRDLAPPPRVEGCGSRGGGLARCRATRPGRRATTAGAGGRPSMATRAAWRSRSSVWWGLLAIFRAPWRSFGSGPIHSGSHRWWFLVASSAVSWCRLAGSGLRVMFRGNPLDGRGPQSRHLWRRYPSWRLWGGPSYFYLLLELQRKPEPPVLVVDGTLVACSFLTAAVGICSYGGAVGDPVLKHDGLVSVSKSTDLG